MRIVSLEKVEVGDVLGKSIFNDRGDLLLAAGFRITNDMKQALLARGVGYLYVIDKLSENITPEDVISDVVRAQVSKALTDVFSGIHRLEIPDELSKDAIQSRLITDSRYHSILKMPGIKKQTSILLDEIIDNNVRYFTMFPIKSIDGQEYEHALDVTLMCLIVGRHLGLDSKELRALSTAALLHDVGKMIIPDLSRKPTRLLSQEERQLIREHPTFSMLLVRENSPEAFKEQTTILHHHERIDGSGYPLGIRSPGLQPDKSRPDTPGAIFRLAEILGPINRYDNLLTLRHAGERFTPPLAMKAILEETRYWWNPFVVKAMVQTIHVYPVGSAVTIHGNSSNSFLGYSGLVLKVHEEHPMKPVLRMTHDPDGEPLKTPHEVDFSDEDLLELELHL